MWVGHRCTSYLLKGLRLENSIPQPGILILSPSPQSLLNEPKNVLVGTVHSVVTCDRTISRRSSE